MICDSCNRQLRDGAKFCGQCGAKTKLSPSAPVAGTSEQKYELNTLSVNATGPDSDGDLSVEIKVSITNRSGSDWDQVNTRTQLISASGFIAETSDTHDLVIEDGATEEFEMNFYGVKARPFMANPELTKTIINVVACSATSKKLGEIILPETSFEVVKIEPFEINASVKLLSGGVWKTDPDDDKEVYVEAKWLVQNLTDTHIPEVKFIAEVVGKSGDEIGDAGGYKELRPDVSAMISGSTYSKEKKLKGAVVQLGARVMSPAATGSSQHIGMALSASDQTMSKIQLFLTFTNGDTSHTEEQEIEIDIPSQFDSHLNDLENSENLIILYKAIVSEGSPCYQDILGKFTWFAYEKLGWHDVIIDLNSIKVKNKHFDYGDALDDFRDDLRIQLARGEEGNMMYLCN